MSEREQEREEHQREVDSLKAIIEEKEKSSGSQQRMQREVWWMIHNWSVNISQKNLIFYSLKGETGPPHNQTLEMNTRVCLSTNLPTDRRISSFLDNPHLPSFACDSKSYSTFGRWFLLYSQSFLKICSHIPQCIKNTMVSAQPEVKWRLGGYDLYVNVM